MALRSSWGHQTGHFGEGMWLFALWHAYHLRRRATCLRTVLIHLPTALVQLNQRLVLASDDCYTL